MTVDDGLAMLDAGASLLQLYTGFIYAGPALVADLNRRLADRLTVPIDRRNPMTTRTLPYDRVRTRLARRSPTAARCASGSIPTPPC